MEQHQKPNWEAAALSGDTSGPLSVLTTANDAPPCFSTNDHTEDVDDDDEGIINNILSVVHNHIRSGDFPALDSLLSSQRHVGIRLLITPNSVGWTALHVACAGHGSGREYDGIPPLRWWRWILNAAWREEEGEEMLSGGVHDHALQSRYWHDKYQHNDIPDNTGNKEEEGNDVMLGRNFSGRRQRRRDDNDDFDYGCCGESSFFARTQGGMTAADLFFARWIYPPMPNYISLLHCEQERRDLRNEIEKLCKWVSGDGSSMSVSVGRRRTMVRDLLSSFPKEINERGNADNVWEDNSQHRDITVSPRLLTFWCYLELLLKTAHHGKLDFPCDGDDACGDDGQLSPRLSLRRWRFLHALSSVCGGSCPTEVARLALALWPEHVLEQDEWGRLPLHLALSSPSSCVQSSPPGPSPLVKEMLMKNPGLAAHADGRGRMPLHVALEFGKTWDAGVLEVMQSAPEVVLCGGVRDPDTGLFPFMMAAVSGRDHEYVGVDVVGRSGRRSGCYGMGAGGRNEEGSLRARKVALSITPGGVGMLKFLPRSSMDAALERGREEVERRRLDTVYELLRSAPESVGDFIRVVGKGN